MNSQLRLLNDLLENDDSRRLIHHLRLITSMTRKGGKKKGKKLVELPHVFFMKVIYAIIFFPPK